MTAAKNGNTSAILRLNRIKQSMIAFTESEDAPRMSGNHRAAHQTKPADGGTPVKNDAAPALSLGQRAYRNELSRTRRKTLDTKA